MTESDTPILIGDELSAAGYRLAGARVLSPPIEGVPAAFEEARRGARFILITTEYAARLPREALHDARRAGVFVAIVPAVRAAVAPPDPGAALRRELGVQE